MSLRNARKTELIINALQNLTDQKLEFFRIYKNPKGTRFTRIGYELAKKIWTTYKIKLPEKYIVLPKTLLLLDERMDWPYYLSKTNLVLFSDMDAFEFTLYQGDINLWANKF